MEQSKKKRKKPVTVSLDEEVLENIDKVCQRLDLSRPQVLSFLFSGNHDKIDLVANELKKVHTLF